jgi:phage shock protein A
MDIDLETIAKKVDALESKVSELEKLHSLSMDKPDLDRVREAVSRYLQSSNEIRNLWKGELTSVEEVRAMRRYSRGY